jgi:hypothetical protein
MAEILSAQVIEAFCELSASQDELFPKFRHLVALVRLEAWSTLV